SCDLRHQLGDAASDLDSVLVELALPEQAGEHRTPQLQLRRNLPCRCALVGAGAEVQAECVKSGHRAFRSSFLSSRLLRLPRLLLFSDTLQNLRQSGRLNI